MAWLQSRPHLGTSKPTSLPRAPTLDYYKANTRHSVLSSENTSVCVSEKGREAIIIMRLQVCEEKWPKQDNQICGSVLMCTFNKPMF
jgi:hypothetical protein